MLEYTPSVNFYKSGKDFRTQPTNGELDHFTLYLKLSSSSSSRPVPGAWPALGPVPGARPVLGPVPGARPHPRRSARARPHPRRSSSRPIWSLPRPSLVTSALAWLRPRAQPGPRRPSLYLAAPAWSSPQLGQPVPGFVDSPLPPDSLPQASAGTPSPCRTSGGAAHHLQLLPLLIFSSSRSSSGADVLLLLCS